MFAAGPRRKPRVRLCGRSSPLGRRPPVARRNRCATGSASGAAPTFDDEDLVDHFRPGVPPLGWRASLEVQGVLAVSLNHVTVLAIEPADRLQSTVPKTSDQAFRPEPTHDEVVE